MPSGLVTLISLQYFFLSAMSVIITSLDHIKKEYHDKHKWETNFTNWIRIYYSHLSVTNLAYPT